MNNDEIDLSGAFEDVKPQVDNNIQRLTVMLTVDEPIEPKDVPRRLLITVNGDHVLQYQNLASLPARVKDVIYKIEGSIGYSKELLVESVKELLKYVEGLPEKIPVLHPPHRAPGEHFAKETKKLVDDWRVNMKNNMDGIFGDVKVEEEK